MHGIGPVWYDVEAGSMAFPKSNGRLRSSTRLGCSNLKTEIGRFCHFSENRRDTPPILRIVNSLLGQHGGLSMCDVREWGWRPTTATWRRTGASKVKSRAFSKHEFFTFWPSANSDLHGAAPVGHYLGGHYEPSLKCLGWLPNSKRLACSDQKRKMGQNLGSKTKGGQRHFQVDLRVAYPPGSDPYFKLRSDYDT